MTPSTIEQAQELLRNAKGHVIFVGGGTKIGTPPPHDQVMSTAALNHIVEYAPSDQVVMAEAGVTLAALQRELAKHGQRLALDAPFAERATLGGIVAANSYGPLRTRYGSVRDLIIGISIVRADGTRAKGGGKVVKTVAGFDLPKLMCGSRGTLAMIATVTFRVHPLPEQTATVVARGLNAAQVIELVRRIRLSQLEPTAMMARGSGAYDV
jgi:glycolate oxidase FAD binding subunit